MKFSYLAKLEIIFKRHGFVVLSIEFALIDCFSIWNWKGWHFEQKKYDFMQLQLILVFCTFKIDRNSFH